MDILRLFIALPLPSEVKRLLQTQQDQLRQWLTDSGIRWTTPEQWHLTLVFLGATNAEHLERIQTSIERAAQRLEPFELSTLGLGAFPSSQRPSVLWLGIGGQLEHLQRLHYALTQQLTGLFEPEERAFKAHLTLARLKQFGLGKEVMRAFASITEQKETWRVESVELYSSQLKPSGAEYTLLHSTPLKNQS